jgi:hypothetical protein
MLAAYQKLSNKLYSIIDKNIDILKLI